MAGGNWGRPKVPQQHRQPLADPPFPNCIDPKISASANVTFTSLRSSTVRTLDHRFSWAPRRNSRKTSAPPFKEHPLLSTPSFWEWVAPSIAITRWSLLRSRVLILEISRELKFASKLHVHSVYYAAKLVHTRRAFHSTVIISHLEVASFRSSLQPSWSLLIFFFWWKSTVLGTKVAFFN